jgi:hypothetical protein
MSEKMMKVCGKNPDGNATALRMDEDGNVKIKRVWETEVQEVVTLTVNAESKTGGNGEYVAVNRGIDADVSEWGMVSLRVRNALSVSVTIYIVSDLLTDRLLLSSKILKNSDGNNISFTIPANSDTIITPDDVPVLNYMSMFSFRVQAPSTASVDEGKTVDVVIYKKR